MLKVFFSSIALGNQWVSLISKIMSFSCENFSPLHGLCYLFLKLLLGCWISWTHPLVFFSLFSTLCFLLYFLGVPSTFYPPLFLSFSFLICFQHPGIFSFPSITILFFFYRRNVFPEDINVRLSFNCTTCFLQVAFLFILNILMLNTVLTRLPVCSYLKARGERTDQKL